MSAPHPRAMDTDANVISDRFQSRIGRGMEAGLGLPAEGRNTLDGMARR